MKKLYLILVLAVSAMSVSAIADESGVVIDGKNIVVTEADRMMGSEDRVFNKTEFPKGIYVIANSSIGSLDRFRNAEIVIGERLKLQGFNVVEKMEDASIAIKFSLSGTVAMSDADKQAAHSLLPSSGTIAINSGALIAGTVINGVPGAVGFLIGGLYPTDSKGIMAAEVLINPVITHGFFGMTGISSTTKDGVIFDTIMVRYKLEKGNEASDDTVLKMVVDQWIKRYLATDSQPVAVSSVVPVGTLAEANK